MASFNKVQLLGRVGRDPETRYTQSGDPISNFSLATSQKVKGEERTEWHQVSVFGKTAEIVEKYMDTAGTAIDKARAERLRDAVLGIEEVPLDYLWRLLTTG
jgi:single-strand DNA-binding protein